jgi:ribosomal protein L7Ae-like RNA K-turn-binding protein
MGTRAELGSAIGKQERVVVAIIDTAFAELISRSDQKPPEVE